jgi:hypothetical protein
MENKYVTKCEADPFTLVIHTHSLLISSVSVYICKSACLLVQLLNIADCQNFRTFGVPRAKGLKHASKLIQESEVWKMAVWTRDFSPYMSFIYGALIKKKDKFSSLVRKLRWDRLQSHI